MNWNDKFALRTGLMKRTAVRELLKVAARPEIISFAGGLPAAELFPLERVRVAFESVLDRVGAGSLQYGETEGLAELRERIAHSFNRRGTPIRAENVLITSGAQQALDLVGRVLLDEGDKVIVENPTYLALLSAWRPLGVEFLPVPSDESGMQVEALESLLRKAPKLIYLTPNFQNPQGTTLSLGRRHILGELLAGHEVGLLEDDPYGELRYQGEALPHVLDLELGQAKGELKKIPRAVIYTGSFSKVLMPGLRVGYVIAAGEVIEKMVQAKQSADLHTSTLNQQLVLELLREGVLDEFLPVLKQSYKLRRDTMLATLDQHFSGLAKWTRPEGGMFLMMTLPEELDATALLPRALEQGVAYVPGEEFHLNGQGRNTVRLNFSNTSLARIEEGIKRLATVFNATAKRIQNPLPRLTAGLNRAN